MSKKTKCIIALLSLVVFVLSGASVYATQKTLLFEKQNGKMVMESIRSDEGNWFMDFTQMLPGCSYHDKLNIKNESNKTYELYMQAVPIEQEAIKDSLLELIYMDVKLDGKTIYSGTASGKSYHGNKALTDVILLGKYGPGSSSAITTDLTLDKNTGLEYNNILTKVDWKFMVREVKTGKTNELVPKTGDDSPIWLYVIIGAAALAAMLLVGRKKKRE